MIEIVSENNFHAFLPLVRCYQEFYGVTDINEKKNWRHFSQFLHDHSRGVLFLLSERSEAIGFCTVYFNYSSTLAEEIGVLNDLFVATQYRGKGAGKRLIARAMEEVRGRGLSRIQWLTQVSNKTAQRLYDSLDADHSEWLVYSKDLK